MFCAQTPSLENKYLATVRQAGYFVRYNGPARGVVGYPLAEKICDKGFGLLLL